MHIFTYICIRHEREGQTLWGSEKLTGEEWITSAQEWWVRICSSCNIYINKTFKKLKQLSKGHAAQQDRCDVQDRTWGSGGEKLMWPSEKEAGANSRVWWWKYTVWLSPSLSEVYSQHNESHLSLLVIHLWNSPHRLSSPEFSLPLL